MTRKPRKKKVVRAWAVLNDNDYYMDIFRFKCDAKNYASNFYPIVPCTITYTPKKGARK